jgi:hypothetical protein
MTKKKDPQARHSVSSQPPEGALFDSGRPSVKKRSRTPSKPDRPSHQSQLRASGLTTPVNEKKPDSGRSKALWLVGACAVVGIAAESSCSSSDSGVTVRRAVYASQEDCAADWGRPEECESVRDSLSASGTNADPGASQRPYGSRWYGPYYSTQGTVYHANGTTTQGTPAGPRPGAPGLAGATGLPRRLVSYDSDGRIASATWTTTDAPARALAVEEATLRRSAIGGGRPVGMSMRTAATTHGATSRGGFTSGSGRSSGGG